MELIITISWDIILGLITRGPSSSGQQLDPITEPAPFSPDDSLPCSGTVLVLSVNV